MKDFFYFRSAAHLSTLLNLQILTRPSLLCAGVAARRASVMRSPLQSRAACCWRWSLEGSTHSTVSICCLAARARLSRFSLSRDVLHSSLCPGFRAFLHGLAHFVVGSIVLSCLITAATDGFRCVDRTKTPCFSVFCRIVTMSTSSVAKPPPNNFISPSSCHTSKTGAADCLQVTGYCYAPFVPVERDTETLFKVSSQLA